MTRVGQDADVVRTLLPEQTGVLVIRVWIERTSPLQLRARITRTSDVRSRDEISSAASTTEEIETVVRSWLEEFVASVEADT